MTNHQNRGVISIESGLKGQILVITLTERTNDIFHTYLMEMKYSQPEICFNLYSFVETLLTHFLTNICATFLSHTKCKTKLAHRQEFDELDGDGQSISDRQISHSQQ